MMSSKDFKEAAKHGCACCTTQAEILDDDQMVWVSPDTFFCNICFDEQYHYNQQVH